MGNNNGKTKNESAINNNGRVRSLLFEYIRYTEFKRLLNQIITLQQNTHFKSLAVLSEKPEEGKSFFVSVLALGYATLLNKRVLIVNTIDQTQNRALFLDRILQEPATSRSGPGGKEYNRVIDLISTRHIDQESHESTDFQIGPYISSLQDDYDLILFDTCALSRTNKNNMDPVIIAKHTNAAILVTSNKSLNHETLHRIKKEMKQWGIQLLGTVYNSGTNIL